MKAEPLQLSLPRHLLRKPESNHRIYRLGVSPPLQNALHQYQSDEACVHHFEKLFFHFVKLYAFSVLVDNGPNPENAAAATTEEVKKPAPAKTQEVIDNLANAAKTEEIKEPVAPQEPASTPAPANGNTDFAELEEKLAAFKDKGNN